MASISSFGKRTWLGQFDSEKEAIGLGDISVSKIDWEIIS
jgi:hypothetical protein